MKKVVLREVPQAVTRTKDRLRGMEKVDEKAGKVYNYKYDEAGAEDVTVVSVTAGIEAYETKINAYNKAKITAAALAIELGADEKKIAGWASQVLRSAKGKFNGDSAMIELLGGTPTSKRKAPRRKSVELVANGSEKLKTA